MDNTLVQKIADAVEVALGDDGHSVVYKNEAVKEAIRQALADAGGAVADSGKMWSLVRSRVQGIHSRLRECNTSAEFSAALDSYSHVLVEELMEKFAGYPDSGRVAELEAQLAEAREQRDRLAQENLERAEAVIAQAANARSLADALKKLNNAARISGGVAGADKNLMDACENAERALSLTGTGRAVNAVLDVLEQLRVTDARLHEVAALCAATERQRDSLRDECERLLGELRSAKINAAHAASQLSYVKHEKDLLRCAVKHVAEADTSNKRVTVGALIHITQEALFDDAARQSHRENNEMAELAALSASGREE